MNEMPPRGGSPRGGRRTLSADIRARWQPPERAAAPRGARARSAACRRAVPQPAAAGRPRVRRRAVWRPLAFGALAAAALGGLMIAPRFMIPRTPETAAESAARPTAARRTAAVGAGAAVIARTAGGHGAYAPFTRGGRARRRARACGEGNGAGERCVPGDRAGDTTAAGSRQGAGCRPAGGGATRSGGAARARGQLGQLRCPGICRGSRGGCEQRGRPVGGAAPRGRGRGSCDAREHSLRGALTSMPGIRSAAPRCSWRRCTGAWAPSKRSSPMGLIQMRPIAAAPPRCRRRSPPISR